MSTRKIAIVKLHNIETGFDYYDNPSYTLVPSLVSSWEEVSEEEYKDLVTGCSLTGYAVLEQVSKDNQIIIKSVAAYKAEQKRQQEAIALAKAERGKKARERKLKRLEKDKKAREEMYLALKEEFKDE